MDITATAIIWTASSKVKIAPIKMEAINDSCNRIS